MKNYILSVYFGYHDSSITFADDKEIILHLEAERYFRKKHIHLNKEQMFELINYSLHYLNIDIKQVKEVLVAKWNNQFNSNETINGKNFNLIETGHHNNHIGTIFPIHKSDCLIVCADGGSEDGTTKFYYKDNNNNISLIADYDSEVITGKFYGTITQMVIDPNVGRAHDTYPGKTMGLAGLGKYSVNYNNLLEKNGKEINKLHNDGVENLNKIFGLSNDYSKPWRDEKRCDLAFTAQLYWQNNFIEKILKHSNISKNIALVGGCALNVSLISALDDLKIFKKIITTPIASDCGQSLGAIMYRYPNTICKYPFLGRHFGDDIKKIPNRLIQDLVDKKIIAWYQGKSEIGPRALGHRSFLGLPSTIKLKDKLSIDIKKREPYRPISPITTEENLSKFFKINHPSPFMTFSPKINQVLKKIAPAIVHYDDTSRIQTISKSDNPVLHELLVEIGKITGVPILMNSSLNIAGEPIVDSIEDAFRNFHNSEADVLYINGKRYVK
ncbi:MAG: carbamoyltransferase C-terminal domain-containing protein [Candidatus Shapirobacteria bacterium]|nr:carbamoyltransferase C-terminal domain-containing protein [Candidatus Shapirobacteria bacterium]MDD4410751.1 carbamoyltransferase C-terminal domain-containing protein [Candidatus Shapirobacteria bacterium]